MAKTWEELEEEEALKHRKNILGAKSRRDIQKENERYEKARIRIGEMHTAQTLGADWRTNPKTLRNIQAQVQKARDEQKARSDASVAKAREDMASGKTSTLVGKGGDPYAGIEGPLPMYKDQKAADTAKQKQSRYLLDEPMQYRPAKEYVGKSKKETEELIEKGVPLGGYESTEGKGVEVRKAIGTRQVFKAMVVGDPTQDKVFDSKKEAEEYLKQTGQQGAVAGIRVSGTPQEMESAAAKYKARAEQKLKEDIAEKERPEKERKATDAKIDELWNTRYERASKRYGREMDPKKLYEQNLAERGLRNPTEGATPEERRRIENENNAARMADFRKQTSARELASLKERQFLDMYADMPKSFKDQQIGGDSSNITARRRYFERLANEEVRRELSDRADVRRQINAKRTTANPEAGMFDMVQPRGDAMSQPFGLVPPAMGGAGFGVTSETITPTQPVSTPEPTATPTPEEPETEPQSIVEELESVGEQTQPPSKPSRPKASPRTESAIKARGENERRAALMNEKREIERALYSFDKRGNKGKMKPKFDPNSDAVKRALERLKQIESEL